MNVEYLYCSIKLECINFTFIFFIDEFKMNLIFFNHLFLNFFSVEMTYYLHMLAKNHTDRNLD